MSAPLLPGDCIGVMAPSSYVEREDIEKSKALLEARGFTVYIHPQTYARHHQSAGNTTEKLDALHELYEDKAIKAIWAAGGGNRALYLLDGIDYELIAANPKPLIGFSDVTALLNSIYARSGVSGFHAQNFKALHNFAQLDVTLDMLSAQPTPLDLSNADTLHPGEAKGVLIGGCLSLFHYLAGTQDCPELEGTILFLEDSGDEISRYDRMFAYMKRMGVFDKINGLILGEFTFKDEGRPFGFSLPDIISDVLDKREIPVAINAPFGHSANLYPLPVGAEVEFFMTKSDSTLYFI